jgi:hypothetical protein
VASGPQFSFASVEAALIAAYGVPPADQARFRSRLTHAQKSGVLGINPGKGRHLTYGPPEMHKLVLICELCELGLSPALQVEVIGELWEKRWREIFKRAEAAAMHAPGGHDIVVIVIGASLMVEGWAGAVPNVNYCRRDELARRMDLAMRGDDDALPPRALMTNLTARLRAFHNALAAVHLKFEQPPIETDSVQRQRHAPSKSVPAGRRRARHPQRARRRPQS